MGLVSRPIGDLEKQFEDQLELLILACKSYDAGHEVVGKHIALSLRVFLHGTERSQSLLSLVGLKDISFIDSSGGIRFDNLLTSSSLTLTKLSTNDPRFVPRCLFPDNPAIPKRGATFSDWWTQIVIVDTNGHQFSRREIVLNVANTDGGAHVDPTLDEAYMQLSRHNSLGWQAVSGDIIRAYPGPELACIRQIAFELVESLEKIN